MRPSDSTEIKEYEARRNTIRARLQREHGEDELLEHGHPERDIHDHLISLLIEATIYAEQLEKRTILLKVDPRETHYCRDGVKLAREIGAASARYSFDLIQLRQQLIRRGKHLGRRDD